MSDLVYPFLMAFLPMTVLTFGIAYYSYRKGVVSIHDDKEDWDDLGESLGNEWADDDDKKPTNNYLHSKWVSFGGGFYGLMALITFTVIEVREIVAFVASLDSFQALIDLLSINTLVDVLVNSIMNMVDAFIWFLYWPEQISMSNGWIWLFMAYAGYNLGRWGAEWVLDR
jgi:hypothetical protein